MAYVDLNPIWADIFDTLEGSEYTSDKQRIEQLSGKQPQTALLLAPFISSSQTETGLPFSLNDYLTLTDWTG